MNLISAHYLSGFLLDWAVAKVLGYTVEFSVDSHFPWGTTMRNARAGNHTTCGDWKPSKIYAQGDRIIESYGIATERGGDGWQAVQKTFSDNKDERYNGETRLIAAMRCLVGTYANGGKIEIPDELINKEYKS